MPMLLGLLSLSLVLVLLILPLTQQGMSLDGIVYAAIAKNMAIGHGSTWDPYYSQTFWPHFHEHPSLAFYFQSLYFSLFGQHFWVERAYDFTMALCQFMMVAHIWLREDEHKLHSLAWLLILWILVPLNVLAYKYNYIEATASCFSTFAALLLVGTDKCSIARSYARIALGGVFIFLGFMTNGPVYTFPLVIPFLQTLCMKRQAYRRALWQTLFLIGCIVSFAGCFFYVFPGAKENIGAYLNTQLFASFKGNHFATDHGRITNAYFGWAHLYILVHFLRAYWLSTLIVGVLLFGVFWHGKQRLSLRSNNKPALLLYLSLALLSSLPIGLSPRLIFHYIIPSAPFYVLFLMYLSYPAWCEGIKVLRKKARYVVPTASLALLCFTFSATLVINHIGAYERHQAIIQDVALIRESIPHDEIIDASNEILVQGLVGAYLARQSLISVTRGESNRYYVSLKREAPLKASYEPVPIETGFVTLWRKIK